MVQVVRKIHSGGCARTLYNPLTRLARASSGGSEQGLHKNRSGGAQDFAGTLRKNCAGSKQEWFRYCTRIIQGLCEDLVQPPNKTCQSFARGSEQDLHKIYLVVHKNC